jgi:hypothetical protein
MTSTQDCSIGIGVESTYKTPVTVTRWLEYLDESVDWNKSVKQGKGLRVASRVARSPRRAVTSAQGAGDFSMEATSKGMGLVWQACLGSSVSNLVSGATFQQVHTLGDNPASLTLQKGLVRIDPTTGVATVDPYTYAGCMVDSWEFEFPNDDIASLKVDGQRRRPGDGDRLRGAVLRGDADAVPLRKRGDHVGHPYGADHHGARVRVDDDRRHPRRLDRGQQQPGDSPEHRRRRPAGPTHPGAANDLGEARRRVRLDDLP